MTKTNVEQLMDLGEKYMGVYNSLDVFNEVKGESYPKYVDSSLSTDP